MSTDEVYGALGATGMFTETTPLAPNSPYSASKASADFVVRAYNKTYGMPVNITRCSNNYGPYQFPEKLIPLMINNCLSGKNLPVYGDGMQIRDWLYVEDHCAAIATVLGWGLYGCRCAQFLLGPKAWKVFALLQALAVIPASVGKAETVWLLAEILNALMSVPNLIALAALSPELVRLTKEYERRGTPCKSPSTPTDASPPPCGNSTPWRWPRKRKAKKSTT